MVNFWRQKKAECEVTHNSSNQNQNEWSLKELNDEVWKESDSNDSQMREWSEHVTENMRIKMKITKDGYK